MKESAGLSQNHQALSTKAHIAPNRTTQEPLSTRELETLKWLAEGLSTKQIAHCMFITKDTVESHRKSILKKLKAGNVAQAIAIAFRSKLIQ